MPDMWHLSTRSAESPPSEHWNLTLAETRDAANCLCSTPIEEHEAEARSLFDALGGVPMSPRFRYCLKLRS